MLQCYNIEFCKIKNELLLKTLFRVCDCTCNISWCVYADRCVRMLFEHLHSMFMKEAIRSPPTTIVQVHKALCVLKTFFVQAVIIIEFGTDPRGDSIMTVFYFWLIAR